MGPKQFKCVAQRQTISKLMGGEIIKGRLPMFTLKKDEEFSLRQTGPRFHLPTMVVAWNFGILIASSQDNLQKLYGYLVSNIHNNNNKIKSFSGNFMEKKECK